MIRTIATLVATTISLLVVSASPTYGQEGWGVRTGISGDPDQFVFGGHLESAPLVDRLVFRPSGEIGLGSDLTVVALNFEFAYKFVGSAQTWTPYVGAGPALNIFNFDSGRFRDDTSLEGGFNMLVGVEHTRGLFTEFKVGSLDSPDIKFLIGYSF